MVLMGIISTNPLLVKSMLSTILAMTIDINPTELLTPAMMEIVTNLQGKLEPTIHGLVLAQQFENVDILGNIQNGWKDFLQSGKAGTFTIGLVLGYVVRGITR
jgi:hypothetical protein